MTEHPYAGPETLVPGETAEGDPFNNDEYCQKCSKSRTPIPETGCCPQCGHQIT